MNTPFKNIKTQIVDYFDSLSKSVFTRNQLSIILSENRVLWQLGNSVSTRLFIKFLLTDTKLTEIKVQSPFLNYSRYGWGKYSFYELGISLRQNSYLSHLSALEIHNLVNYELPSEILYVNMEQPQKPPNKGSLEQYRIDLAFNNPTRVTNNIAKLDNLEIFLLNGMFTGKYGVIKALGSIQESFDVTDIERTLVDVAVRPIYSGGVKKVLNAYRKAKDKISVNKLSQTLLDLGYTYPYHQVIGFYLEKAGIYTNADIELFQSIEMKFNFYLAHDMKDILYSDKWRLYYPSEVEG